MPIRFDINRDKELTVITMEGEVSFAQWLELFATYDQSGATLLELYDLQRLDSQLEIDQIKEIVAYGKNEKSTRPKGGKTALVVSQKVHYGLSRVYAALAESMELPWEANVFTSLAEAYQWLGLSDVAPR